MGITSCSCTASYQKNEAGMYAITLEHNELVIVEINGNLDNILKKAIYEHRLAGMTHL